MKSINPRSPQHPDNSKIISVRITVEVTQLQFVPSYELEAEIEQRQKGKWLANQEQALWHKELKLKLALKEAKNDKEYNRLHAQLRGVQQAMTDIQKFDGSVDG